MFQTTMDEVLLEVEQFAYEARHAESDLLLKFNMQMASRALRCALQIYIDWFDEKETKNVFRTSNKDGDR